MDILSCIRTHVSAMRLPLYAVTLSAVAKADTPTLLTLHWHGFMRQTTLHLPGLPLPPRPVAGSALQLNDPWHLPAQLDTAMLDAAWHLGAWNLERENHRPWWRLNASQSETLACHRAFAHYPEDENAVLVEAPAQEQLLDWASTRGYIRWLFRPRVSGLWNRIDADDATLDDGDARVSNCPVSPLPLDTHRDGHVVYRLGRGRGIWCR